MEVIYVPATIAMAVGDHQGHFTDFLSLSPIRRRTCKAIASSNMAWTTINWGSRIVIIIHFNAVQPPSPFAIVRTWDVEVSFGNRQLNLR